MLIFNVFWVEYVICIVKTVKGGRILMKELIAPGVVAAGM